jgi:hypothetical protein
VYHKKDRNKILAATDYIDAYMKSLWTSHLTRHPKDRKNWKVFLAWTKCNINQGLHSETTLYDEYQKAHQLPRQSPRKFNIYLTSLERDLPSKTEKELAMSFYTRLDPALKNQLLISNIKPAKTRTKMVEIAQDVWDGLQRGQDQKGSRKRRHKDSSDDEDSKPKQSSGYRRQKKDYQKKDSRQGKDFKKKDQQQSASLPPPKPPGKEKAIEEGLCFRCGSKEHMVSDCPHPPPANVKAISKRSREDSPSSCPPSKHAKIQEPSDNDSESEN